MPTQKVCPRCRSIYMGSVAESICPTCQDSVKRSEDRRGRLHSQHQRPENPWLESLIPRAGTTTVAIGGCTYTFKENDKGVQVCRVSNPNHHKFLLKSGHYRPYSAGKP